MSWQALILLHLVFSTGLALQARSIARKRQKLIQALSVNAVSYMTLCALGIVLVPILGRVSLTPLTQYLPFMLASSFAFATATFFAFKSLNYLDSAFSSILNVLGVLITIVLAMIFLHERLSSYELAGSAILLPTVWYVIFLARSHHGKQKQSKWRLGIIFSIGSSVMSSIGLVIEKYLLSHVTVASYVSTAWTMQMLWAVAIFFAYCFYKGLKRPVRLLFAERDITFNAFKLGSLRTVSGFFLILAEVASNHVSLMSIIGNFRIILITLFAGIVLKERAFYLRKLSAAGVSVASLGIIMWK